MGSEHPVVATSLNRLAILYKVTGAYAQAEPLYQRALRIREQAREPAPPAPDSIKVCARESDTITKELLRENYIAKCSKHAC